ncbi:MAG TPA: pyrimidine 5'-nucleotidase [Anaerolineales bacterium]|nr:pyrimidine 5'-nucleotidase [Anaerolineales bacterium]
MAGPFRILFLDLDDTLYASATGLWSAIGVRILRFMVEIAGVPSDRASSLRDEYFHRYGTTLTGLRLHQGIDPLQYLRYVHDLPLADYLQPDPATRAILAAIPLRKIVLTNADRWHAGRVLDRLGLDGVVDQIIDVIDLDWLHKPDERAYRRAMELARESEAAACLLLDDITRNLEPAAKMGMTTVLVGTKDPPPGFGHQIDSMHDLPALLTKLGVPASVR